MQIPAKWAIVDPIIYSSEKIFFFFYLWIKFVFKDVFHVIWPWRQSKYILFTKVTVDLKLSSFCNIFSFVSPLPLCIFQLLPNKYFSILNVLTFLSFTFESVKSKVSILKSSQWGWRKREVQGPKGFLK